ncbi:MAG TPA: integrase core domain-containing protein [Bacilli bacterium]|nr:integrase core domain-containing protein [Bacilli bacterium]
MEHKLIRPRAPRHNGKIERRHRNDNNRFYSTLKFYNCNDLIKQMKAYFIRSNNICRSSIGRLTPLEKTN